MTGVILKAVVLVEGGFVYTVDAIEFEGSLWLVLGWNAGPTADTQRPAYIASLARAGHSYSYVPNHQLAAFQLTTVGEFPKALFDPPPVPLALAVRYDVRYNPPGLVFQIPA